MKESALGMHSLCNLRYNSQALLQPKFPVVPFWHPTLVLILPLSLASSATSVHHGSTQYSARPSYGTLGFHIFGWNTSWNGNYSAYLPYPESWSATATAT